MVCVKGKGKGRFGTCSGKHRPWGRGVYTVVPPTFYIGARWGEWSTPRVRPGEREQVPIVQGLV